LHYDENASAVSYHDIRYHITESELVLTFSSPTGQSSEGFNWSDNFRSRAERTASIAGGAGLAGPPPPPAYLQQSRAKSVATMEPPATAMPKPKEQVRPDHFQERILKGDFYMD
jgi:hypothetical protein